MILILLSVFGFVATLPIWNRGFRHQSYVKDYEIPAREKRGIMTDVGKLLKYQTGQALKHGKRLIRVWEVERLLLNDATLKARQFGVDHYVKLGGSNQAREDFFAIRNRLQDIKMERHESGEIVTWITRVGNRIVKLKENYKDKSSTLSYLKPATRDQRDHGVVIHYCKLDKSRFC